MADADWTRVSQGRGLVWKNNLTGEVVYGTDKPAPLAAEKVNTAETINRIRDEILAQGTSEKYWSTGSGLSKTDAARMMAEKLVNQGGITDLKQFGKVPVIQSYPTTERFVRTYTDEYGGTFTQMLPQDSVIRDLATGKVLKAAYDSEGTIVDFTPVSAGELALLTGKKGYYADDGEGGQYFKEMTPEEQAKFPSGKITIDTGQTAYGNKVTGQAIPMEYDRAKPDDWGGTFAGDSSSGFGVQFKPDGTPIFYTHYDTVDQLGGFGTIISVLAIIPSPIQPFAMAANAAIALERGDVIGAIAGAAGAGGFENVAAAANFANAVKNEDLVGMITAGSNLAGVSTSNITQSIGESLGATSLVGAKALGGAVLAGAGAAVRGEDAITAAITGAAAGAFSGMKDDKIIANAAIADTAGGLIADEIATNEYGTFKNYDDFMAEMSSRGLVGDPNVIAQLADEAGGLSTEYGTAFVYDTFINQAIASGLVGEAPEVKAPEVGPVQNPDVTDFTNSIASYDTTNTLKTDSSGENYSLEGRNYSTQESTQGAGGSPVNATMTNLEATSTAVKDDSLTGKQLTDIGKVVLGGLVGGAAVTSAADTFKQGININATPSGDIYKDAPLAGFKMVKMQNAEGQTKYVPFIKDKAQLPTAGFTKVEGYAKGGFITRR